MWTVVRQWLLRASIKRISYEIFVRLNWLTLTLDKLSLRSCSLLFGPILWGHSGPLCHALSLLLLSMSLWTSMRTRPATVAIPGEWQCKIRTGGKRRLAVANGPNIFQMLLFFSKVSYRIQQFTTCVTATDLREFTCHLGSWNTVTHLPSEIGDILPPLSQPINVGTRFSDPELVVFAWLHADVIYPPENGHPSQY